jgi:hypothetical protein
MRCLEILALTDSMEYSLPWEANSRLADPEIPRI